MITIVNFKTYEEGSGKNAIKLAKEFGRVAKKLNRVVWLAPQLADIPCIARLRLKNIRLLAQSIDPVNYGRHTGWILPENVKENGAIGTLLNHSEKQLSLRALGKSIKRAREVGLITIVCARSRKQAVKVSELDPDYIAYEPPELIAGKTSVSEARPRAIELAVKAVRQPLLVGAGIHSRKDVERSLELGAAGILVASAVVKAKKPAKILESLLRAKQTS